MVTLPPPLPPAVTAAQALPLPTSIPVQLAVASVTSTVAALQQRVVVSVLAVTVDLQQQLLNILTPQGAVGLRLPAATAQGTPQQLTLPNGQQVPLQTVLAGLANLTPAQIKSGLQLLIEPQAGNATPAARLLLAPEALNARPASPLTQPPAATAPQQPQGTLRTLALPLPPDILATLPPRVQQATVQAPDTNVITKFLHALAGAPATAAALPVPNNPVNKGAAALLPEALARGGKPVDILATPQAGTVAATIVGSTARGDTIVQLANGTAFSLSHMRGGAVGDTLYIKPAANLPAGAREAPIPPALLEALDVLETINPALAARVITQTTLPLHTLHAPQVASSMLFFLTAMGGAFSTAQQPTLHAMLERALPRAARDKLVAELAGMTRTVADATGVEWRGTILPTAPAEGLHSPVWFYVQQRPQGDSQGDNADTAPNTQAPRQTRFLIDLELTRLGHTQLEGIASKNKVDLKLNTRASLPRAMQNELVQIYTNAASAYGFAGELIFTNGAVVDMRRTVFTNISS